ncbi:branched-chain amino acid ABC transporter substrate-binding protein [Saccharomonospora sp. CUA-673]|uniref:ABC transporter substrate-binding protein n=1 Tax=Saccharomonospora sp. CUA-673 TaxID=1904969 RepID=UPI0009684EB8|nr:ABC transporter substrate-binding protein [Saccharomonospora sp. CUA-673]OLT43190.1 branched-chain amino acid ABC transporter substrate-binding protein [Saccharomonospora sp. CUA-673]
MARTKRIRTVATATACTGVLLASAACGAGGSDSDTIVIGMSGPLTGGAAAYGTNIQSGLQLAIDDLNEQGVTVDGQEYQVELRSLDDHYAPDVAATNAQRLAEQDDAAVIFVPHAGGIQASQELNSTRTEFLLGAYSSDPKIVAQGNELTMMIPPNFESYIEPFVDQLKVDGVERLGLLGTSSEYGQEWTRLLSEEWSSRGGEVLSNNSIDYAEVSDFAGPVSRTLAQDPDVIFLGGPSQPTALIVEEARNQGYEGSFLFMDQPKFEEMEVFTDPENLNDAIGVKPAEHYDEPGTEHVVNRWDTEITDERPLTTEVSLNYQAMTLVVKAMEIAGSIDDPHAIRGALEEALGEVDDSFHVTGFPDEITDAGHLLNTELEVAYRTPEGEYEYLPIDQVDE